MDFKHIITNNKWLQFTLLLTFNIVIFILFANIFPIRFLANDDVVMAWIADGVLSGIPDCHLIFMNAIYGSFLTLLYNIAPNIEWYSVCFSVFHVVAITIIISFFYKKIQNKIVRWVVICLYYLLWFRIIQFFQFTTTTAMFAFAGILLFYNKKYIIGGTFLLISSMLRFDAMGLIGLLSIPLFIKSYRFEIKGYFPVVIILLIICGVHFSDKLFYQSTEWQEYREYNHYRSVINDSPNNWRMNESNLPESVSVENLKLLRNSIVDPCQISNEDVKKMAEIIQNTPIVQKCRNLPYSIKHYQFYKLYLGVFLLMFILYVYISEGRKRKIIMSFVFLLFIGVLCFISLNGNIKPRIIESVCFVLFSYVILLTDNEKPLFSKNGIVAIVPLLISCGILIANEFVCMKDSQKSTIGEQVQLIRNTENLKIVNINHDFQCQLLSPFRLYDFPKQKMIPGGWLTKSPFCEIYSYKELVDGDIVLFIKKGADISFLQKAIEKNYDIETEQCIISTTEHYAIVGLQSKQHEVFEK